MYVCVRACVCVCVCVCEAVGIVYDHHYYQIMLQVNNFLYKPEIVRSY
jgi:hypothetical protein